MTIAKIQQTSAGWWASAFGLLFLAFVLYAASSGSLPKYKAWLF